MGPLRSFFVAATFCGKTRRAPIRHWDKFGSAWHACERYPGHDNEHRCSCGALYTDTRLVRK